MLEGGYVEESDCRDIVTLLKDYEQVHFNWKATSDREWYITIVHPCPLATIGDTKNDSDYDRDNRLIVAAPNYGSTFIDINSNDADDDYDRAKTILTSGGSSKTDIQEFVSLLTVIRAHFKGD